MMKMTCHSKEQTERLNSAYVYTYCKLKAYKSLSNEFFSTVKLEINNFENDSESGITIGHWKYFKGSDNSDNWIFIPITSSHLELVCDLFYIKNIEKRFPKKIGEIYECNVSMETLLKKD